MEKEDKKVTFLKLGLYLISLWILLFMLIVLKTDISQWGKIALVKLVEKNIVPIICFILILLGGMGYIFFLDTLKNTKNLPIEIQKVEGINYENLSFLATYIIPLVCFPMETKREIFVMFSVIIVIGCIFVKTNLYYTNPSLVLLGFNVYKVHSESHQIFEEGIVIVRGKIDKGDTIKYLALSDNVYFGRRM